MDYDKQYGVILPKRTDLIYKQIENFEDYEFTYCIAYEMAIRTPKFKELIGKKENERGLKWQKKMISLGINNFELCHLKQETLLHPVDLDYKISLDYWKKFTIYNIKDGINIVITYYLEKNKIYEIINDNKDQKYSLVEEKNFGDVYMFPTHYYIPCKKDGANDMIRITEDLPLQLLDDKLLSTLKLSNIAGQYIETEPIFSRPKLKFQEDRIINLPLNLNLEKEELEAYLNKVIKDHKNNKSILQDQFEFFSDRDINDAILPKSQTKIPKKDLKKIALANAFYIYDLYQELTPRFKEQHEKNFESDPETQRYLKEKIIEITGFTQNAIEIYHAYMSDYIDKYGYVDLLVINYNRRSYSKEIKAIKRKIKKNKSDRINKKGATGKRLTKNDKDLIITYFKQNISQREIARKLDIALSTAQYHIKKYTTKSSKQK